MGTAITVAIIAAFVAWAMGTTFTVWYYVKFAEEFLVHEMGWPAPGLSQRLALASGAFTFAAILGLGRGLELLLGRHEALVMKIRRQMVYGQVVFGNASRLKAHAYLLTNGHSREEADAVLKIGPQD